MGIGIAKSKDLRIEAKRNAVNTRVNDGQSRYRGNGDRFAMGNAFGLTVADASGQEIFRVENTDFPPEPPRDPNKPKDRLRFH